MRRFLKDERIHCAQGGEPGGDFTRGVGPVHEGGDALVEGLA